MTENKSWKTAVWIGFALAALAHIAPPAAILASLGRRPLIFNDFSLLLYFNYAAQAFFERYGQFWGYDPHFMAGYPLTFIWQSNVGIQAFSLLWPGVGPAGAVKLFTALAVATAPATLFFSFRNVGLTPAKAALGATLGLLYFQIGLPMMFIMTGMPAACFAAHVSLLALSAFYRWLDRRDEAGLVQTLIFCPLSFLLHKTAFVMFAVPAVFVAAALLKKLDWRRILGALAAAALAICVNSFWLEATYRFIGEKTLLDWAPHWQNSDPLRPFKDYFTFSVLLSHKVFGLRGELGKVVAGIIVIRWALAILGVAGVASWAKRGERTKAALFSCMLAYFFLFSYYGSFNKTLSVLNPTRFIASFHFLLCFPAAEGLAFFFRSAYDRKSIVGWAAGIFLAAGAVWACSINTGFMLKAAENSLANARSQVSYIDERTKQTAATGTWAVVRWIQESTDGSGRILLEDSGSNDAGERPQRYGESQLPALFPNWAEREFIGGPYPSVFLTYHQVDFTDGRLLQKPIAEYSVEDVAKLLNFYDVRWIAAWNPDSVRFFESAPERFVRQPGLEGDFAAYRFVGEPSRFISGSGHAAADLGGIYLYRVKPDENGGATISYHYIDTLKSWPPAKLEPAYFPHDPKPYIRIQNPPENLHIYNGYSWREK